MSSGALGDPVRFAALIAPVVDRVVISVHLAARIRERHSIEGPIGSVLELRLPLLAGLPVPRTAYDAIARYVPDREAEIEAQVAHDRLRVGATGELVATAAGRALVADLVATLDAFVADQWAHRDGTLPALDALARRAVDAGRATGGDAFTLVAGAPLPEGASTGFRLWSRLGMLRYYRADAHAAAWAARDLDAEQMVTMPAGAGRDEIEADTNRRAAGPWLALTESERLDLLAGLGAL